MIFRYNSVTIMEESVKERGTLLTIWLVLMLIANALTAIGYLVGSMMADTIESLMASTMLFIPTWVYYVLGFFGLLNVVFTIFLFKWKKWAFYAFCGIAVIVAGINLFIGFGILDSLSGFLGVIILYLLMRPKWDLFE